MIHPCSGRICATASELLDMSLVGLRASRVVQHLTAPAVDDHVIVAIVAGNSDKPPLLIDRVGRLVLLDRLPRCFREAGILEDLATRGVLDRARGLRVEVPL